MWVDLKWALPYLGSRSDKKIILKICVGILGKLFFFKKIYFTLKIKEYLRIFVEMASTKHYF
jgi:hypothetical protein